MARGDRGPKKFSFPLPRRSRSKLDVHDVHPAPSIPSGPERPSRHEDTSSKAHRVLGTSDTLHRSTSRQSTIPPSPGYMSITVSEASFGSHIDERNSQTATENSGHPKRPSMSKRPSSNVLGRTYTGESRQGSDNGPSIPEAVLFVTLYLGLPNRRFAVRCTGVNSSRRSAISGSSWTFVGVAGD